MFYVEDSVWLMFWFFVYNLYIKFIPMRTYDFFLKFENLILKFTWKKNKIYMEIQVIKKEWNEEILLSCFKEE